MSGAYGVCWQELGNGCARLKSCDFCIACEDEFSVMFFLSLIIVPPFLVLFSKISCHFGLCHIFTFTLL